MLLNNRRLPVEKMIELENRLVHSPLAEIGFAKTDKELAETLGLEIVVAAENELPKDTEAMLTRSIRPDCFGLIQVKEKYRVNMFACIHEVIHYVFDVGCGKEVQTSFERKVRGRTQGEHEQEINYMTAAYAMPYHQILKAIRNFDSSAPKMDELKFIQDLCRRYGQSRESVLRRIREVKRIARSKKF